jgi:hypothetical protein
VYHNRHVDGSIPVNPHFHILFDKKERMGINFLYLKEALKKLALLFDVQFHFMMESRETGLSGRQEKVIEKMAMTLQRGTVEEIATYLEDDKVYKSLKFLDIHYAHSHNLSYFLKQISILNKCLKNMDIDLEYNGINLKNEIYFYLTQSQFEQLKLLKSQQKIHLNLSEVLDREILKYAYGFNSTAMTILKDKFEIKKISKENLTYSIPSPVARQKQKALKRSYFHEYIQQDIRNALSVSASFYRLKNMMLKMGYTSIKVKRTTINQHTWKETGFEIKTKKNSVVEMSFKGLGLSWSRILKIYAYNLRRQKKEKIIESELKNYKKEEKVQTENFYKIIYKVPEIFKIKYSKDYKFNLQSNLLLEGFEVQYSAEFNITTYISDDIVIVDYPCSLEIKKCNDVSKGIDVISQFLPENISIDKLDIIYQGFEEYVDSFEKRMKENQVTVKAPKKSQVQRPKFKM